MWLDLRAKYMGSGGEILADALASLILGWVIGMGDHSGWVQYAAGWGAQKSKQAYLTRGQALLIAGSIRLCKKIPIRTKDFPEKNRYLWGL